MLQLKSHTYFIFINLIFSSLIISAQDLELSTPDNNLEYFEDNFLRYDNHSYLDAVKTVTLHPTGWPLGPAVFDLSNPTPLMLEFDVLDSAMGNFMYSIIHCDHNWQKSDLDVQEYIMGMPEDYITEYDYSRNTYQKYIHYYLEFPNYNMEITKSGNYIIKVFDTNDPDHLILTRRFCVTENILSIDVNIHQPTSVSQRYSHQEVDFKIRTNNYEVTNPYSDLHVVILQNHNWNTAIHDLPPRFVKSDELDFDYDGQNAMPGLNEFRLFDIKNTRYTGRGVERMVAKSQENNAFLEINQSRLSKVYLQQPDINGWYYIQNDWLNTEGAVDADYVRVHFNLQQKYPLSDGDVYVFGALTDWQIKPEAKMTFNQMNLMYETDIYLKQGLYNYLYAYVRDGELEPDLINFEGSHFQTENEYAILVYHRPLGLDYDRLLSYKIVKHNSTE